MGDNLNSFIWNQICLAPSGVYFMFAFIFGMYVVWWIFPQTIYCWGSILERKELATLTGRAPELCGWALWLGSVAGPWPPLVLLLAATLNSVTLCLGFVAWALSSSWLRP